MSILLPSHIAKATTILASHGRGGDDRVVHLTKEQGTFLKSKGGSGTINPHTGLREYVWQYLIPAGIAAASAIAGQTSRGRGTQPPRESAGDRNRRETAASRAQGRSEWARTNATAEGLAPQELFERAQHLLASDRGRFAGSQSPYPRAPGPRLAPMSPLTNRANTLEAGWAAQPKPQAGRIATVGARPNAGISPENIRGARENMNTANAAFGQNVGVGGLKHQFGPQYNPTNAQNIVGTEVEGLGGKFGDELNNASNFAAGREGKLNNNMLRVLQNMQQASMARRGALTGSLREMGTQQQAHGNMVNDANAQEFRRQESAPQNNMDRLESALAGYQNNGTLSDDAHPDTARGSGRELVQALRAYGIDPNSPVSTWTDATQRRTTPGFTGQLVAPQSPETVAAQSMLHRMSPNFQNENTPERKKLMEELMGRSSVGDEALAKTSQAVNGSMSSVNPEGSRIFSNAMAKLSNKYLRLGQFNSPQHMSEAEELARGTTQASGKDRSDIFKQGLSDELDNTGARIVGNQRRLSNLADQEHSEWNMAHGDIGQLNDQGMNKWKSAQNENEDIYKNFQGESGWAFPHVRGQIRREEAGRNQATISGLRSQFNDQAGAHSQEIGRFESEMAALQDQQAQLNSAAQAGSERERALEASNAQSQRQLQEEQQRQGQLRAQMAAEESQRQNAARERDMAAWNRHSHPNARAEYEQQQHRNSNHALYDPGANLTHNVYGRTQNIAALQDLRNRGWTNHPFYTANQAEYDLSLPRNIEAVRRSHEINQGINDPSNRRGIGWGADRMSPRPAYSAQQGLGRFLNLPGYT